ncbi:MAG: hypothetical protein U5N56_11060 [Candidatus Marinimicrobia bacterium]|nr:hypothetical protein [Candidatus Neomarinimicrobiota bacterium]
MAKELGISLTLTIGDDPATAKDIQDLGCEHRSSDVHECVVDVPHKVVSTAAYMSAKNIAEACSGIRCLVKETVKMIES